MTKQSSDERERARFTVKRSIDHKDKDITNLEWQPSDYPCTLGRLEDIRHI